MRNKKITKFYKAIMYVFVFGNSPDITYRMFILDYVIQKLNFLLIPQRGNTAEQIKKIIKYLNKTYP